VHVEFRLSAASHIHGHRCPARVLAPFAIRTPLLSSPALDERVGAKVFLKPKCCSGPDRSNSAERSTAVVDPQDARGAAWWRSLRKPRAGRRGGGANPEHAATIVMPADAPRSKRERTKGYGAEVVLYDRDREDREAIAGDIAQKHGATLVRPYDDPRSLLAGHVGREIAEDLAALGITRTLSSRRHQAAVWSRASPQR